MSGVSNETRMFVYFAIFCILEKTGHQNSGFTKVEAVSGVNGSTVQLKCPHRDTSETKQIDWFKKFPDLKYVGGTNINPNLPSDLKNRLAVTGDQSKGEYHLSISDVRKSDEGTYECSLSSTVGAVTTIKLTVITNLPSSLSMENVGVDKILNGIEGNNLVITCHANGGEPKPDVKLLIPDSVVKIAKETVQYALEPVNRFYDGKNVTCLAGYEEISYYPLNDSAKIYLKLKPNAPTFSSDLVQTEETKPLLISCTSTGSRPKASIYWLLGDRGAKDKAAAQSNS
ncbi:cell adhesion molecule 2-like [Mytilus trossulus]|uniref:cell adhesion molecule 2-like n=1 Tax=Mytilus trossulus TaxID=6551 RepID=UPI00300714B6